MKTESFKAPRRDYASGDANRRPQFGPRQDDRPRDRGNNVNVRFVRRQLDRLIRILILEVVEIQKRWNFTDAGRGQRKAIVQAGLTPMHNDLTRA